MKMSVNATVTHEDGEKKDYQIDYDSIKSLILTNISQLLEIAVGASDEHIRKTFGGEHGLLELIEGYFDLAEQADLLFQEDSETLMKHYRQGRLDEAAERDGRLMQAFDPD